MKLTQILYKDHIGRFIKKHWWVQSKRAIETTGAERVLASKNIPVYKPESILHEETLREKINIVGIKPKPIVFDKSHPNWHERICHTFKDQNVLLEGLTQAKIITNTVDVQDGLPERIDINKSIKGINRRVREIILNSHLLDAQQEKLPKIKDPLRPAFNFPRDYSITEVRRNTLIIANIIQLIELLAEPDIVKQRAIFNNLYFLYPFEKNGNLIQFELRGDTLLTSTEPLKRIYNEDTNLLTLPSIEPIRETITLNQEHIYEIRNCYPIDLTIRKCHPHTLFIHYNREEVKNIFEEEITEEQIYGRSLLKSFTVAASYAKQLYGENVKVLPKPVTLQCVQTDGRLYHFGILQLNTLDLADSTGTKNVWYQTERIPLFESCSYVFGKPTLEGYRNDIIKHLLGFYYNM